MTIDELLATARESELRLVPFLWCGNDGTVRARRPRSAGSRWSEWEAYSEADEEFEQRGHFEKY